MVVIHWNGINRLLLVFPDGNRSGYIIKDYALPTIIKLPTALWMSPDPVATSSTGSWWLISSHLHTLVFLTRFREFMLIPESV